MAVNIPAYFRRYDWACEQVDVAIWRSTFTTEREQEFDLYVMLGEEWVHFAVSPLVIAPLPATRERVYGGLLRLNQRLRLAHFAIDDAGDINLLAELPRRGFTFPHFATAMDALVAYTAALAHDLTRLASEPGFHSPLVPELD
jgi:hypothetical protein